MAEDDIQETGGQETASFDLKSGESSLLVQPVPSLIIRIDLDPVDALQYGHTFRLFSDDGTYDQTLTVSDDLTPGDAFIDLLFDNLSNSGMYSLEVEDDTDNSPYFLFEGMSLQDLIAYYAAMDPTDAPQADGEDASDAREVLDPDWVHENASTTGWGGDPVPPADGWYQGDE